MKTFPAEHEFGDEYYYNHLKIDRNSSHLVGCDNFFHWVYYNKSDHVNLVKELRAFNSLYELNVQVEDYKNFDNSLNFRCMNTERR